MLLNQLFSPQLPSVLWHCCLASRRPSSL